MKKTVAMLLVLVLCLCGCSAEDILASEGIVLPTIPTQMASPNLPTTPQDSAYFDDEDTEAANSAGETYPWETEFNPAGYTILKENFGGGRAITWIKGYKNGRAILYYNDGLIEDRYFYPSGALSHMYIWYTDGSYSETRWLDNGEVVTMDDGTKVSQWGTIFYSKTINADGSWEETQLNSEGKTELIIRQLADGSYQENRYNSDGFSVYELTQGADGYYHEVLYYDNGNISKIITDDPAAERYQEERYYGNGQMQYCKSQTPDEEQEVRYDEEGFTTYRHTKSADYEIELLADESGKLVKVIENGQTIEDSTALVQYAASHNFRN